MVHGAVSGCSVQVRYMAALQGCGAWLWFRATVQGRGSRRSPLPPEGSTHRAVRRERARAGERSRIGGGQGGCGRAGHPPILAIPFYPILIPLSHAHHCPAISCPITPSHYPILSHHPIPILSYPIVTHYPIPLFHHIPSHYLIISHCIILSYPIS